MEFKVSFTSKEAALFAISLGYGSSWEFYERELRYVWEDHEPFVVVPTFAFALVFWAQLLLPPSSHRDCGEEESTSSAPSCHEGAVEGLAPLPKFPPPFMSQLGLIPRSCLRFNDDIDLRDYPVLHTWQSITWHSHSLTKLLLKKSSHHGAAAACCTIQGRFLSVEAKSVGTFVTTETSVAEESTNMPVCTIQSTALLLGMEESQVVPMHVDRKSVQSNPHKKVIIPTERTPFLDKLIHVTVNQALLYRMGSGDSNRIHVDPSALALGGGGGGDNTEPNRPILHGLATLGMAARALEQEWISLDDWEWTYLEATFRKPVFIGETLRIRAWHAEPINSNQSKEPFHVMFQITRKCEESSSGQEEIIVLDQGLAKAKAAQSKSRL